MAEIPFVRPEKPLRECRLALVTTGGVHLPEDARFDIDDPFGDCSYREIPNSADALTWTHAYYAPDRGGEDLDSVFPLWTLRALEAAGIIHDPGPLVESTAPEVAAKVAADGADAVLLTPS